MSLDSSLKFKLQALLYGQSNSVVVNSSTNTIFYQIPLRGFSGADVTSLKNTFTFQTETRLSFMVTAIYNTVDSVLAAWENPQKALTVHVFKMMT
jgi:hypothetical protein